MTELVRHGNAEWETMKALALDGVTSPHSRRGYESALDHFLASYRAASGAPLSKTVVNAYEAHLEAAGYSASTINGRLSSLRKPIAEAAANGRIPLELAAGIARVRGVSRRGIRLGNWLDRRQAERWIQAPNAATLTGKRDRSLFAVLLGCPLRRSEAVGLTLEHIQQRQQRWVIGDLLGKHGFDSYSGGMFWTRADGAGQPRRLTESKSFQPPAAWRRRTIQIGARDATN